MSATKNESSITYELGKGNKELLVFFGGIAGGFGMPPFEFSRLAGKICGNKIFVRDFFQSWYQKGLPPYCDNFSGIINFFKDEFNKMKPEKITLIGNSAGGFIALGLGRILGVDKVISFSPQTFVTRLNRFKYLDYRWRAQMRSIYASKNLNKEYLDIKNIFDKYQNKNTIFEIHYCSNHRLDSIHAERLSSYNNVTLRKYPEGGHGLIKELKKNGELEKILIG